MAEWLEQLGYGAESCWKVVSSNLPFTILGLENSVNQHIWVPVSNQGKIRQQKERDGLRLSCAVLKIQWFSNPHCPYGYKAMGNLYLLVHYNEIPTNNTVFL